RLLAHEGCEVEQAKGLARHGRPRPAVHGDAFDHALVVLDPSTSPVRAASAADEQANPNRRDAGFRARGCDRLGDVDHEDGEQEQPASEPSAPGIEPHGTGTAMEHLHRQSTARPANMVVHRPREVDSLDLGFDSSVAVGDVFSTMRRALVRVSIATSVGLFATTASAQPALPQGDVPSEGAASGDSTPTSTSAPTTATVAPSASAQPPAGAAPLDGAPERED